MLIAYNVIDRLWNTVCITGAELVVTWFRSGTRDHFKVILDFEKQKNSVLGKKILVKKTCFHVTTPQ